MYSVIPILVSIASLYMNSYTVTQLYYLYLYWLQFVLCGIDFYTSACHGVSVLGAACAVGFSPVNVKRPYVLLMNECLYY